MYKKEREIESSPTMCHIERCCFYYFVRNSLVALLEALCAQMQIWVFDVWSLCWNRTGDLGTDSPALWPTKLVVYRLQWPQLWHSESVCSFMHLLTHARCAQCHEFFFNSCVFGLASPCTCLRYDKIDRSCTSHTFASDPLHCYEFGPPEFFSITFKFSIIYCTQLWKFPGGANFDLEKHAALEKKPKPSEITCKQSEPARTGSKIQKRREFVRGLGLVQNPKSSFERFWTTKELLIQVGQKSLRFGFLEFCWNRTGGDRQSALWTTKLVSHRLGWEY